MSSFSFRPRHGHRILICTRGNCAEPSAGRRLEEACRRLIARHGLDNPDHPQHTTCTLTNCLAVCQNGPVMIVHPAGVKYQRVDRVALERIFTEHILGGQPVEALRATEIAPKTF